MVKKSVKKINVALIINSLCTGGSERLLYNIARSLNKSNFNVYVITLFKEKGEFAKLLERENDINLIHIHYNRAIKFDLRALFMLRKKLIDNHIDIVQTFHFPSYLIGFMSTFLLPIKGFLVYQVSEVFYEPKRNILIKRIIIRFFKKTYIIAPSNILKEHLIKIGFPKEKIKVIHIGVDLREFNVAKYNSLESKRKLSLKGGTTIGIVGRLVPVKGHIYLLKALMKLKEKGEKVVLLVVGDGPLHKRLVSITEEYGLSKYVHFLGQRDDVPFLISAMDIYVQPSLSEAGGGIEGMAMGKPVVISRVGAVEELVENFKTGLLVKPGDPNELANAIELLIQNSGLRKKMGENAFKRVRNLYDFKNTIIKIESIYRNLCNS